MFSRRGSETIPRLQKSPAEISAGDRGIHTMIRRSGQEVLVHAEREHPVRLVRPTVRAGVRQREWPSSCCSCRTYPDWQRVAGQPGLSAVDVLVNRFNTDVEALGHIPLQARTDAPDIPVVVATGGGDSS